jgi:hypothetical protein
MMKFISPGGWFSLEYPASWAEFEDTEDTFLFYNPNKWNGNFRISAFRDSAKDYANQCISWELKNNPTSTKIKVGEWECAYSAETFQEEGAWYTTHIWVTGKDDLSFECSFTVVKGEERTPAEEIIQTLKIRKGKEAREIIPIRVLEIGEVNAAYEWVSNTIKKTQTKDFTSQESDIEKLQKLIDSGNIQANQRPAWENIGLAFGAIIENEMDGMTWVSVIDGQKEYPALQFEDLLIEPSNLVWGKIKAKTPCNLKAEYELIREEVENIINK